jgi:hypothetical protein
VNGRAGHKGAREAIQVFADELTDKGFDIRGPEWDRSQYLKITNVQGVLCDLAVRDDGIAEWCYHLCLGCQVDAAQITAMVLGMLGADAALGQGGVSSHRNLKLKGTVGRALAELGMKVSLEVLFTDNYFYEVYSAIEASNPARPDRGRVQIADDSLIRWECRIGDPSGEYPGISPEEIAETLAKALAM